MNLIKTQKLFWFITFIILGLTTLIGCSGDNPRSWNDDENPSESRQGWDGDGIYRGEYGVFDLRSENRVRCRIFMSNHNPLRSTDTLELRYRYVEAVLSEEGRRQLEAKTTLGHEQFIAVVITPSGDSNNRVTVQEHILGRRMAETIVTLEGQKGRVIREASFGRALTEAVEITLPNNEHVSYDFQQSDGSVQY